MNRVKLAAIENGVVVNVIEVSVYNRWEFADMVEIDQYNAGIGDTYDGERFYRDGEMLLTESEKLAAELEDAKAALELLGVNVDE